MNERVIDFDSNIEIRCLTECHVDGAIVSDPTKKQKKNNAGF